MRPELKFSPHPPPRCRKEKKRHVRDASCEAAGRRRQDKVKCRRRSVTAPKKGRSSLGGEGELFPFKRLGGSVCRAARLNVLSVGGGLRNRRHAGNRREKTQNKLRASVVPRRGLARRWPESDARLREHLCCFCSHAAQEPHAAARVPAGLRPSGKSCLVLILRPETLICSLFFTTSNFDRELCRSRRRHNHSRSQ